MVVAVRWMFADLWTGLSLAECQSLLVHRGPELQTLERKSLQLSVARTILRPGKINRNRIEINFNELCVPYGTQTLV